MSAPGAGEEPEAERLDPGRLLAFSDGVVAIALTLLVLPLADLVPDRAEPGLSAASLVTENLSLVGSFLLSFVVIGRFWMVHHRLFDRVRRTSRALVWLNLAWLLSIVVLPFPTEMVGVFRDDAFALRFYVGTLFASSLSLTAMTLLVERSGLGDADARPRPAAVSTTALLGVALLLVLVAPGVGYPVLFLLFAGPLLDTLFQRLLRRH